MVGDYVMSGIDDQKTGVKKGDVFIVASVKPVPVSKKDPYTQRLLFLTHKVEETGNVLTEEGMYLFDPKDIKKVGKKRQKELNDKFTKYLVNEMKKDNEKLNTTN